MFKWFTLTILILGATVSLKDEAQALSGNDVFEYCKSGLEQDNKPVFALGYCYGMIDGLWFLTGYTNEYLQFCPPKGTTSGQLLRVVVRHMEKYPQYLHEDFKILAYTALQIAFPCKK